jgi:hypothetical protein
MTPGQYRARAAELWNQAVDEQSSIVRAELENIAVPYLKLAAHAARREATTETFAAMMAGSISSPNSTAGAG